ncbi:glycosyl transferase family protein [Alcanivorax hongdengensis A-11-3]|uniref:Glycosyl transferase family protein n=1 Tax=Alcanivorax hongdengensis A-11-3 TaxID=1177179 RepID=L0WB00_9GAMM|nr:glycosyltransferase family 2 protein [Alcanivorax hongdengensis]EKF73277.1 glycosyl transferase family protein [Alcanivorax hongdengensis A-11-3]
MQSNQTTISVIIPAYNVENYIAESLKSLVNQTVYPDEVIIIDDGSTDSTLKIVESFEFPFKSTVISTENRGQGQARNLGMEKSESDYLYFFDSDDILDSRFIEFAKEKSSRSPSPDLLLFSGEVFHDGEDLMGTRISSYKRGFSGDGLSAEQTLSAFLNEGRWDVGASLYMVKRELMTKNGLSFHSWHHEDTQIFYQLLSLASRVTVSNEVFFYRRIRRNSIMTMGFNKKHAIGSKLLIESLIEIANARNSTNWKDFITRSMKLSIEPYIRSCRYSGTKIDLSIIMKMLSQAKSPKLYLWTTLILINKDAINIIRKIKK